MSYAIVFELDLPALQVHGVSYSQAYAECKRFFATHDFTSVQTGLYFGAPNKTSVDCVVLVQEMAKAHQWFASSVKELKLLKLDEVADLKPALALVVQADSAE